MSQSLRKLDDLLQTWARQRAADAPTLHRLTAQILADAVRHGASAGREGEASAERSGWHVPERSDGRGEVATAGQGNQGRSRFHHALRSSGTCHPPAWLVAAASLLVALGLGYAGFRLGSQDPPGPMAPATDAAVPAFAQLDPPALRTAVALLSELEWMFDQRLQWVAETSGQVRLRIAEPGEHVGGQPTVLVRITVVQRDAARATSQVLWTAQVVGGDQQLVRLGNGPAGATDEPRLQVWAFALPDGRIMVDSELRLAGPVPLHVASGGVQDSGVPTKVYAGRQGGGEFEVYQTVALLKEKVS